MKWGKVINSCLISLMVILMLYSLSISIISRRNPNSNLILFRMMTVLSGSMEPSIMPGDVIFVTRVNPTELTNGDVISYRRNTITITHRIVEITEKTDGLYFKTQGDNVNTPDDRLVSSEQVLGKYLFKIPKLGFVLEFLRSIYGIVFIIGISLLIFTTNKIFKVIKSK